MSCNAIFTHAVHLFGSDLHLERTTRRTDDRGVQALVHIELWHRDVVFEAPWHRVPKRMDRTEHRIAIAHGVHDDAHCDQVVYLRETLALLRHLRIDGVEVLRAPHEARLDADLLHLLFEDIDDVLQIFLTLMTGFRDHARDLLEFIRLEIEEGEILKLPLDGADAKTVRDRGIDLARFTRLEDTAILAQR